MRMLGYSLIAVGSLALIVGMAIVTSKGRPPEWSNWYWEIAGHEVHMNQYAVWWYSETEAGDLNDTTLVFWPPRIQTSSMTKEHRALLKEWAADPDWQKPDRPYREALNREHENSDRKRWFWPDWYGRNAR